jgi:hypothetical protein
MAVCRDPVRARRDRLGPITAPSIIHQLEETADSEIGFYAAKRELVNLKEAKLFDVARGCNPSICSCQKCPPDGRMGDLKDAQ